VRIRRLAGTGRLARLARLWMGRNPLRRRADRIEALITAGLLTVFLAGAPLSWGPVGRWVQHVSQREQHAQRAWHQIPAVLLEAAPAAPHINFRAAWSPDFLERARWVGPGGRVLVGDVPVRAGTVVGRRVLIWVDGSGRPTGPPLVHSALMRRVIGAEVLTPVCLGFVLLGVAWLVRWVIDRRRLAAWEAAWASIGPRWTRHR